MKTKFRFGLFLSALVLVTIITLALGERTSTVRAQEGAKAKATPTITKKMNANFVDNFHASANPRPNRLLALDANATFPESAIPGSIQRRVTGTCAAGSSIRVVNANGSVECESESAIPASIQLRVTGTCAAGSSIRVVNANGSVECESDDLGGGGGWSLTGNEGTDGTTNFIGTKDNQPLVVKTNNAERLRVTQDGKIGMGTTSPAVALHVAGAESRLLLESAANTAYSITDYKANGREWHTGVAGSQVQNGLKNKYYIFDATAGITRMVIDADGNVGIGTPDPYTKLLVRSTGTDVHFGFQVENANGDIGLAVRDSGLVYIGELGPSTTSHACLRGTTAADYYFTGCSSAAEYVPTIDAGNGFPETADLVSMAPAVKNPYGDAHGPFVVRKSATACDPNLLGYIVKPELGADGVKLNDHYLPLAIYGYFPAKVTMENGAIKRGDPITSSSKAGYGMKATDACKVIGYALEDANVEGTIQVFANYGDSSAAQVAELRAENGALKEQLATVEARLDALEESITAGRNLASANR